MDDEEMKICITEEYIRIINIIKDKYDEDLSYCELKFSTPNEKALANYNFLNAEITFFILGGKYKDYKNIKEILIDAILHELAHAITDKYKLINTFFEDCHNISFGIVYYCLQREITGKTDGFYREYDMGEEFHIKSKKVDRKELDGLINHIKFDSINVLAAKSFKYAEYVREKILKTMTYKQWEKT